MCGAFYSDKWQPEEERRNEGAVCIGAAYLYAGFGRVNRRVWCAWVLFIYLRVEHDGLIH